MRPSFTVLAAAALLAGVAAVVAAQEPTSGAETRTEVSGEPPSDPVAQATTVEVPIEVAYAHQEGSGAVSEGPTSIFLSARDGPGWVDAAVEPWILEAEVEPGGGETAVTSTLQLAVDDDAPPGAEGAVEVHAVAAENDGVAPSSGTASIPVEAAGGTDANASETDSSQTGSTSGADSTSGAAAQGVDSGSTIPGAHPLAAGLAAAGLAYAWRRRGGPLP